MRSAPLSSLPLDARLCTDSASTAGALIQPLKVLNGGLASFSNSGATYSWTQGGFEPGTPPEAQVGAVSATPTAVWSGSSTKASPGGFQFEVDIPAVAVPVTVFVHAGVCGNLATLNATLSGATPASFTWTQANAKTGTYFLATLTVPPAKADAAGGKRTLTGTWTQTVANAATVDRNIQFHAIAVDAGPGPVAGGAEVACSHGSSGAGGGQVVLQAATLV